MENDDRVRAIAALRRGLELGMSHIDTAELYGSGEVEKLVGEAIAGRRDEVFLVSKVMPQHATYEGTLRACESSLRRLRTDRLDVYLLHWPGSHPLADTIRAFEELVHRGKIRSWGVSNFDVADLEEALAIAGPDRIACNQVLYHLEERAIERQVLPWCAKHGVALVGYSPFAEGRFPSPKSARGRVLDEVGRACGATAHGVALAFLLRHPSDAHHPQGGPRGARRGSGQGRGPRPESRGGSQARGGLPRAERQGASADALMVASRVLVKGFLPLPVLLVLALAACNDAPRQSPVGVRVRLEGTGATVPKALFASWKHEYARVDPDVTLEYAALGSGAGVRAIKAMSTSFGVSDVPLSDADAATYADIVHVPLAVEAIAAVYRLRDVSGTLSITEDVLADMLLGRIGWWDDPKLVSLNPLAKLPHAQVRVVYRGDESGSSYLLTEWLSKTSHRWSLGATRALQLPVGTPAQKDEGVIAQLQSQDGSVGYLSAVTASERQLPAFAVRNQTGRFVTPSLEGMRAAASVAQFGDSLRADATNSPGDLAYPICSFTFALIHRDGSDAPSRRALARFMWWATHDGQKFAPPLGFGALPGELSVRVEGALRTLRASGEPAL
jgi:phosphate ABC transporter phosphate-binding protein